VLDMNEELGDSLVQELGAERLKFFRTDVSSTESIAAAVKGSVEWAKRTGKELGGVVAAAGVANPSKVTFRLNKYFVGPNPDGTSRSSTETGIPSTSTASTSS